MNPTTTSNNIDISDNSDRRRRRTSVASTTASIRSTRSSWRVPSAKQPPRTQLSAVFAEVQAPSRSPSNQQSAMALLEARYASSSSVSSTSPNLSRMAVPENPLEEALTESPTTNNADDNSLFRGRQSTQRNITLAGTSVQAPLSPPLEQPVNIILSDQANSTPAVTIQSSQIDLQSTATTETVALGEQKKRKQSSMTSGWFGTSGRSKVQKVATIVEQQDAPSTLSEAPATADIAPKETKIDVKPEPPSVTPIVNAEEPKPSPSTTTIQTSSSGWFSRSKAATPTPAPVVATPEPIAQPPSNPPAVVAAAPAPSPPVAVITTPAPPPSAPAASSPSRASWFGSLRGRPESVSTGTQLDALDTTMSTPHTPSKVPTIELEPDEPPSALSESITDESMTATITPMTYAEAQAQSRLPGPQSWFRLGGKRESITPSVDSTVPSLPPSPKRENAPMTMLVPISNPSVSSLGSSSARYALSFPLLGKPKANLQDALKEIGKDAQNQQAIAAVANAAPAPIPEISEEMVIDSLPPTSSAASISSSSSAHPPPSASWWPYFGRPAPVLPVTLDTSLSDSGHVTSSEGIPSSAASSIVASSTDGHQVTTYPQQTSGGTDNHALPDSASWFGLWPWGGQAGPDPENKKTDAELVKEEALARDQTSPPLTSASTVMPELSTPRLAEIASAISGRNPIEEDSVENRASWTSFFSLRAAHGAKQVTQAGEEEDVMDLDGDPDAPVVAPSNTNDSIKGAAKIAPVAVTTSSSTSKPSGRSSSTEPSGSRTKRTAPPLTDSDSIRQKVVNSNKTTTPAKRSSSATPSKRSLPPSAPPKAPNMVLPTFGDTFYTLPRALPPYSRPRPTPLRRIMSGVFGLGAQGASLNTPSLDEMKEWQNRSSYVVPKDYEGLRAARDVGRDLPRVGGVLGIPDIGGINECKRVAILGIHGWFPGTIMRTLLGEPTGTSPKFASMMETAVLEFMDKQGVKLEKITCMPLEGDGTIERRVEKLYEYFLTKKDWIEDLHEADVIFVATHSQGSVVSTQLLDKLISDGHVRTSKNWEVVKTVVETSNAIGGMGIAIPPPRPPQRICCLALCGIHLGPLLYLGTSSFVNPYIQYFESAAARELFEFQDTDTEVSKRYIASLDNVLDHGVKFVYVASLDDQVVPIYSGLFTAINHPRILRALYIDGDAYSSSDFLSNLLVLLIRMRNAGIDDGGLLTHLSEATAGSLSGVGHSTAYLDSGAYELAVRYLFETGDALGDEPKLEVEPFVAKASRNDYEIPWALRGLISDPRCQELFGKELTTLRSTFDDWHPRTSAMKEVRKKLEPIRGRRSRFAPDPFEYSQSPTSAPSASPTTPIFAKSNNR